VYAPQIIWLNICPALLVTGNQRVARSNAKYQISKVAKWQPDCSKYAGFSLLLLLLLLLFYHFHRYKKLRKSEAKTKAAELLLIAYLSRVDDQKGVERGAIGVAEGVNCCSDTK